jgi:hypothetical protein
LKLVIDVQWTNGYHLTPKGPNVRTEDKPIFFNVTWTHTIFRILETFLGVNRTPQLNQWIKILSLIKPTMHNKVSMCPTFENIHWTFVIRMATNPSKTPFDTDRWKCLWIFNIILGGSPTWGAESESSTQSRQQFLLGFLSRSNKVVLLVSKKKVLYNLDLSDGRHRLPLHFYIRRVQIIKKLCKKGKFYGLGLGK